MNTIPAVGTRVLVARTPEKWGPEAKTWIGTSGIVRVVFTIHVWLPIVGVEFPGWDGGHDMFGLIKTPSGWYFILHWLEPSGN